MAILLDVRKWNYVSQSCIPVLHHPALRSVHVLLWKESIYNVTCLYVPNTSTAAVIRILLIIFIFRSDSIGENKSCYAMAGAKNAKA